jgi:membrane peptidoglycan carboxypeptidase
VSNPDSPRRYRQDPDRDGRNGERAPGSYRDPYGRDAGYRQPADGNGRPATGRGNGSYPDSNGRASGNASSPEYGPRSSNRGDGYSRDGYSRDRYRSPDGGSGRGSGRTGADGYSRSSGNGQRGYDRSAGNGSGGYGRSGGNGSAGYGRNGNGSSGGYGRDTRRGDPRGSSQYDRYDGGRGAGNGSSRTRGSQVGSDLRSKLGLGRDGSGNGYGADGYADDGYADSDVNGFRDSGTRGATALRERATSRFTGTSTRGTRRAGDFDDDGGDGTDGGRRKGSWWRRWTWKKAALVALGMAGVVVIMVIAGVMLAYAQTDVPTAASEAALQQSSTVYFSDGKTQVGTFSAGGIDRQILASNQIPPIMKYAMVAAEDRRFYSEGGISPTGIMRATYIDLEGGDYAQGGSTLTQQFVRNYYATIGTQQTLSRKIKEIFVAIKLSHEKSKDWILTEYLNMVPFGDNAYGVAAASQTYFNEPAMDLTISQAAMLAAMPNQPSFFTPNPSGGPGYTALVNRWQYVLSGLVKDGVITQQVANAQKFPTVVNNNQIASGWTGYKGYIMQAVEDEMQQLYGIPAKSVQSYLDSKGLKIVTTFNPSLMNELYNAVNQEKQQMQADGSALPSYANIGAVLEQPGTGAILAMYSGPNFAQNNYDMALQSRNQVGSSFKPYVLATAVSEGMDVQNSVLNAIEPMCIPPDSDPTTLSTPPTTYSTSLPNDGCPAGDFPVNIAGENSGPLSVPVASAISSDPAYEDLIHRTTTASTIAMAKAFGVNVAASGLEQKNGEVGIALGIASLTVEEQATTFATLANDGEYVTPHVIAQLIEPDGSTIPLRLTHRQVLTPAQAADVDYALSFDTQSGGTGYPEAVLNPYRPTIGKTGTTDDAQSAFFIGAIPQFSLGIGMFTDNQNQSLNGLPAIGNNATGGYGGAWPAAIWRQFMESEFSTLPIDPLPTPNYSGFTKWVQVPQKNTPTPKPHPSTQPTTSPTQCPGQDNGLGDGNGNGNGDGDNSCPTQPTPPPTPSTPNPTPSTTDSLPPVPNDRGGGKHH